MRLWLLGGQMTPLIRVGKPVGEAGGENAMVYFCLTPLVSQPDLVDGEEGIQVKEVRADRLFRQQMSSIVNLGMITRSGVFWHPCATATYFLRIRVRPAAQTPAVVAIAFVAAGGTAKFVAVLKDDSGDSSIIGRRLHGSIAGCILGCGITFMAATVEGGRDPFTGVPLGVTRVGLDRVWFAPTAAGIPFGKPFGAGFGKAEPVPFAGIPFGVRTAVPFTIGC
ncbi:hypothetical protein V8E54_013246 [Elaphomyces granulatus]